MTAITSSDGHSTKAGSRKRIRVDKNERAAILDEFERSGLSGTDFAQRHGIKYSTFASWVRGRRRDARGPARRASRSVSLAEVVVEGPSQPAYSAGLRVHLPGGAWAELDGQQAQSRLLAQLLRTLDA